VRHPSLPAFPGVARFEYLVTKYASSVSGRVRLSVMTDAVLYPVLVLLTSKGGIATNDVTKDAGKIVVPSEGHSL